MSTALDPYTNMSLDTAELSWLFADGLIGADPKDLARGSLSAIAPSADLRSSTPAHRSFRYRLRPGIRWHDGKPFVAEDVVACLTRLKGGIVGKLRPYRLVERIEVIGPHEFVVHLIEADPAFPLAFFGPLGSPGVPLIRPGALPIGTGPFRLESHRPDGTSYVAWSGSPRGDAASRRLSLQYLASAQTQDVMLQTREIDIALGADNIFVRDHHMHYIKQNAGIGYALLNVSGTLANPNLREGIARAVDRNELVVKAYRNWADPLTSILPERAPGGDVHSPLHFDLAAAKRSFAASPNVKLTIVTTAGNPERIALLLQEQLRRAGAQTELRRYSDLEYAAPNGPLQTGRFDIALWGDVYALDPDLLAIWGCDARPPRGNNFSRLCDPRFDADVRAGRSESALHAFWRDVAVVPLAGFARCTAATTRVRGLTSPNDLAPSVYNCTQWSLT
ncbi:MAG TPA: ABC transporter substrate-binding protein [Candidatus Baltobacteraceae bacterium]